MTIINIYVSNCRVLKYKKQKFKEPVEEIGEKITMRS
jgi:hypothetical protein